MAKLSSKEEKKRWKKEVDDKKNYKYRCIKEQQNKTRHQQKQQRRKWYRSLFMERISNKINDIQNQNYASALTDDDIDECMMK